jgi:lactobin A/cerein 7B family class IIb bacteriocin
MELTDKQMKKIDGGVNWGIVSGIAAAVVFVVGLISGYTNPSKCHN